MMNSFMSTVVHHTTSTLSATTIPSTAFPRNRTIRDCDDVYESGFSSDGIYTIFTGQQFVEVYCEMQREEKNWLVIIACFL